ncbi:MAG TPA: DUF3618 domain-containing protein [Nocardioides sp.]|nr:DUF3618 domain-containing protein [Nocardioides sp.]
MSTDTAQQNGASPTTPQELEREVERNREELARTVDALHHKLDVKAQAQQRVARLKDSATTGSGKPRPAVLGAVGAAAAGVALLVWLRRR